MVPETREQKNNKFCCKVFSIVSHQISDQAHKHDEKLQLNMRVTLSGVQVRETEMVEKSHNVSKQLFAPEWSDL